MDIVFTANGRKAAAVFSRDYTPSDRALEEIQSVYPDAKICGPIDESLYADERLFAVGIWCCYYLTEPAP